MSPLGRSIRAAVLLFCLGTGLVIALGRTAAAVRTLVSGPEPRWAFYDLCRSRIPRDDTVYVLRNDDPVLTARLYPRPVRVVRPEDLPEARRQAPDAWFLRCPVPFDPTTAWIGRLRDRR